jgi:hypothetical protein
MSPRGRKIAQKSIEDAVFGGGILLTPWVYIMKTKGIFSIDDFKRASFEKKCDVVTTQSNYIVTRTLGNCKVYLYSSENYFIEVFYSPIYRKVLMINAFDDVESMLPYTEKVSLDELGLEQSEEQ